MLARIRRHFSYTNAVVTVALIFAMAGGAYAASKFKITSIKEIKPSVVKQLRGKAGAPGIAGTPGAAGPQGPQGPQGPKGDSGVAGSNGVSVETASFSGAKGACKAGGVEVKSANPTVNICNGVEGKPGIEGKEGSPWTAGGTLPAEKTETGAWSTIYIAAAEGDPMSSAAQFTLPLKASQEVEPHYIGINEELAGEAKESPAIKAGLCKGNVEKPEAAPGNVCVFAQLEVNAKEYLFEHAIPTHFLGTSFYGTDVIVAAAKAGEVIAEGTWAVTGD
jgi:hypothetical protein